MGALEGLAKDCKMADYRDALSRAARMTRIANQGNLSDADAMFLTVEAMELYKAAQRYKEEILLYDSFIPWTGRKRGG